MLCAYRVRTQGVLFENDGVAYELPVENVDSSSYVSFCFVFGIFRFIARNAETNYTSEYVFIDVVTNNTVECGTVGGSGVFDVDIV